MALQHRPAAWLSYSSARSSKPLISAATHVSMMVRRRRAVAYSLTVLSSLVLLLTFVESVRYLARAATVPLISAQPRPKRATFSGMLPVAVASRNQSVDLYPLLSCTADQSFAISMTIYSYEQPSQSCSYEQALVTMDETEGPFKFTIICNNFLRFTMYVANSTSNYYLNVDHHVGLTIRKWYHLAVAYDAVNHLVIFYHNGAEHAVVLDRSYTLVSNHHNSNARFGNVLQRLNEVDDNLVIQTVLIWKGVPSAADISAAFVEYSSTSLQSTHVINVSSCELPTVLQPYMYIRYSVDQRVQLSALEKLRLLGRDGRRSSTQHMANMEHLNGSYIEVQSLTVKSDGRTLDSLFRAPPSSIHGFDASSGLRQLQDDATSLALGLFPSRYLQFPPIADVVHQTHRFNLSYIEASHVSLSRLIHTWQHHNLNYKHRFWLDADIDGFVQEVYPNFYPFFKQLPKPVMKADLFRYMVIYEHGGVYADIDTECVRPIDYWTQPHQRKLWLSDEQKFVSETEYLDIMSARRAASAAELSAPKDADGDQTSSDWRLRVGLPPVNVIIGVEADFTEWPGKFIELTYSREHQLCQWAFAATRGHPLMEDVIIKVMSQLRSKTPIELLDLNVLEITGPGIWTDAIRDYLIRKENLTDSVMLMGHVSALQIGDVYILPVNGFGHTTDFPVAGLLSADLAGKSPRCVEHQFRGSWKKSSTQIDSEQDRIRRQEQRIIRNGDLEADYAVEDLAQQRRAHLHEEYQQKERQALALLQQSKHKLLTPDIAAVGSAETG